MGLSWGIVRFLEPPRSVKWIPEQGQTQQQRRKRRKLRLDLPCHTQLVMTGVWDAGGARSPGLPTLRPQMHSQLDKSIILKRCTQASRLKWAGSGRVSHCSPHTYSKVCYPPVCLVRAGALPGGSHRHSQFVIAPCSMSVR